MLRRFSKIIAFLLLLVFTQKLGVRLWMHDWLHETQTRSLTSSKFPTAEKLPLRCDCIDDMQMPLTATPAIVLEVPRQQSITLLAAWLPPFSAAEKVFYSLKGPPVPTI
jgi:hypothetical protein